MTITMYDTAFSGQFPQGAAAYAAYVDGSDGDQPNYDYIVRAFPKAHHLSITVFGNDADCADVEAGAMGAGAVAAWFARQVARGARRPVIYASVSVMESRVLPVVAAFPGGRDAARLWTAHYGAGEHVCGPATCNQLSTDADGTQWTSSALGRDLDQSLLQADFFGTPPQPESWEDILMASIPVIAKGSTEVQAVRNWQGLLIAHGYNIGTSGLRKDGVDGVFGAATDRATHSFQESARLLVDGRVGPQTWGAALAG